MSKYNNSLGKQDLDTNPLVEGEGLILSVKPKKSAYIINRVLTMMPFALLWLAFDAGFITMFFGASGSFEEMKMMIPFLIIFFIFHLFPVWMWLGNVLTAGKTWQNTKYYVTDKRIIIQSGFIGMNYQTIYYKDIRNVNLRMGMIDKMLGVGDIYLDIGTIRTQNGTTQNVAILVDLENPQEIYTKLQKVVLDIQTDIEFPNAYRPEANPGYKTKYKG